MKNTVPARVLWKRYRYQGRAALSGTIEDPKRWLCEIRGQLFLCIDDDAAPVEPVGDLVPLKVSRAAKHIAAA